MPNTQEETKGKVKREDYCCRHHY